MGSYYKSSYPQLPYHESDPYAYSVDRSDQYGYGSHSGYGGYHSKECCPLVVDPLTVTAILGGIIAAAFFFNRLITMNITVRKRKKRDLIWVHFLDLSQAGKTFKCN